MTAKTFPQTLEMIPLASVPDATISIPGSKSLTNRALILAALAQGTSELRGALASEDTAVMIDSLRRLGFSVEAEAEDEGRTLRIAGLGGEVPANSAELYIGNSGTSTRFLTALCALGEGRYRLDGTERMRQRPQADLLDALADMGVSARSEAGNGSPPLIVESFGELPGGTVRVGTEASSQFLTAILMISPYAKHDVTLEIRGKLRPFYVDITRKMMAQWGVQAFMSAQSNADSPTASSLAFRVATGQSYQAQPTYQIEPDASSASYFFAAAAISGGRVTVPGLSSDSLQGDVRFATEVLVEMGCTVSHDERGLTVQGPEGGRLRGVNKDMSAISDTSLTLAAIAPFADSPTTVTNIAHSRLQECDRISAICTELTRLGVIVEEFPDGFTIYPATEFSPASIQTYEDHRVAMSFALIGLRVPGVKIENPACVAKTFPDFWERLELLRGTD